MGGIALFVLAPMSAPPVAAQEQPAAEEEEGEEGEDIVVQATRTNRRLQDEPLRVEVINREEIEEKIMMTPGNISMLVAETGGVRVQVTSPGLGASAIRMLGMKGRYTSLLSDGLPLSGGQTSFGLLQTPPTDLGQVEVIKGAASALYGPTALGGVINLVSRRPRDEFQAEILSNLTSRDGQDVTAYVATPLNENWSGSITAGAHRQTRQDIDNDGWADMPGYRRWTARPRLYWNGEGGKKLYLTVGSMSEQRAGGTLAGQVVPDGSAFPQRLESDRLDAGIVAETPLGDLGTLHFRASGVSQDHRHQYGDVIENDRHSTLFGETSLSGVSGGTSWLAGLAFQSDRYRSEAFPAFDYTYDTPAIFAQVEHEASDEIVLAGSGRIDFHSEYGTRFSPRLSALYKPGNLTIRTSLGRGFYAPTPFVEEIESVGLSRLAPLSGLRAETADTASFDIGYRFGRVEANVNLFASHLHNAVRVADATVGSPYGVRLVNLSGLSSTQGVELLLRYRISDFTLTGSYVHVDARERDPDTGQRQRVPLTPHNTAGFVAMWEKHGRGRIGFETYYTGRQELEDNPYRSHSRPYVEMGLMGEAVLGRVSLFVNAENLLNVRQTRYDPLLRQTRFRDGSWTVDAWSPLDGFTLNGGFRIKLGAK